MKFSFAKVIAFVIMILLGVGVIFGFAAIGAPVYGWGIAILIPIGSCGLVAILFLIIWLAMFLWNK